MELLERDASDSAVLEARIAVPYAFAELGAYGQALDRYNDAIAAFERESGALDESINAIRGGTLLTGLMDKNPGEEMGWFWNIADLPEMPHGGHLAQVFAQHEFQEAFKNFRDLQFLAKNLADWQDNLGVYSDMLDNRRNAYKERLPQVKSQAAAVDLDAARSGATKSPARSPASNPNPTCWPSRTRSSVSCSSASPRRTEAILQARRRRARGAQRERARLAAGA